MWKNINKISKKKIKENSFFNMILSTHSMEEAEILCDTVGWLKSGSFMCLGNPEQLKIQFSGGYKLHIKFIGENTIINDQNEIAELKVSFLKYGGKETEINNIIQNYSHLLIYVEKLIKFLCSIKDNCQSISIDEIGQDGSFNLTIYIIPEKKGILFGNILGLKASNQEISEISLNMESLENILTRFQ